MRHFHSQYWHFYISSMQKKWDPTERDDDHSSLEGDDVGSECEGDNSDGSEWEALIRHCMRYEA